MVTIMLDTDDFPGKGKSISPVSGDNVIFLECVLNTPG